MRFSTNQIHLFYTTHRAIAIPCLCKRDARAIRYPDTEQHLEDKKHLICTLHVICAHAHMLLNDVTQLGITVGLRHLEGKHICVGTSKTAWLNNEGEASGCL